MIDHYAAGALGVQQAREASQSALPDAPVIPDRHPDPAQFRIRAAGALHRLADRIGPIEARAAERRPLRAAG
jgi:hypothetical protein